MFKKISIFVATLLLITSIAIPCLAVNSSNTDEKTYVLNIDKLKEERDLVSFNAYFAGENRVIILYAQKVDEDWTIRYKDENGKDYNNTGVGKDIFPANNYLPLNANKGLDSNKLDLIFYKNGLDIKNENNAVIMNIVINCETDINSIKVLDKESIEGYSSVNEDDESTTEKTTITTTTTTTIMITNTTKSTSDSTIQSDEKENQDNDHETNNKIWIITLVLIIICILAVGLILLQKKYKKKKISEEFTESKERPTENPIIKNNELEQDDKDEHTVDISNEIVDIAEAEKEKPKRFSRKEFIEIINKVYAGEEYSEGLRRLTAQIEFSNSYDLNFSNSVKPRFIYSQQSQENYVIVKDKLLCLNYDRFNRENLAAYNDIRLLTRCFDIIDEDGDTVEPSGQRIKWLEPGIVSRINDIFILDKKGKLIVERDYEE